MSFLLNSFRQLLLCPGWLVLWRSWLLSGNPGWSDVSPLFGFCHILPVMHRVIEKVLPWLGPEQMISSWSLLVSPRVDACSFMWLSLIITKLHFILSWLVLRSVWFGVLCVFALQLYSFLPCIFYVPCHISYIITSCFGARTSFWGLLKEERNNFPLATQILWGPNVLWIYHWYIHCNQWMKRFWLWTIISD